jgi:hypothetical protein
VRPVGYRHTPVLRTANETISSGQYPPSVNPTCLISQPNMSPTKLRTQLDNLDAAIAQDRVLLDQLQSQRRKIARQLATPFQPYHLVDIRIQAGWYILSPRDISCSLGPVTYLQEMAGGRVAWGQVALNFAKC